MYITYMEEYKPISDFYNYEISNLGNVRNKKTGRILKPSLDTRGYYKVNLCKDKATINKRLHRLVADAFLENTDNKNCVDHIDNNILDNSVNNLKWATTKENAYNSKLSLKNKSGSKGVYFDKTRNKWRAQIRLDGICICLGNFDNIEDAKAARKRKAYEVFGIYKNICEN